DEFALDEPGVDDFDFALDLEEDEMIAASADHEEAFGEADERQWNEPQPHGSAFEPEAPSDDVVTPKKTGPLAMLAALAPAAIARFGGGERTSTAKPVEAVHPATPLFGMTRTERPVSPEIETVEVDEQ